MSIKDPGFWENRAQKAESREYGFDGVKNKNGIWLPGIDCACISKALDMGVTTLQHKQVFIERDPSVFKIIESWTNTKKWKEKPRLYLGDLEKLQLNHKYGFFFCDLCGNITKDLFDCFRNVISPKFEDDGTLLVTTTYSKRNNKFLNQINEMVKKSPTAIRMATDRCWTHKGGYIDKNIQLPAMAIILAFSDWNFSIHKPFYYKDTNNPMVMFKFTDFNKKGENKWQPMLQEMGYNKMEKSTMEKDTLWKKRSAAAHKAWKTRRLKNSEGKHILEMLANFSRQIERNTLEVNRLSEIINKIISNS